MTEKAQNTKRYTKGSITVPGIIVASSSKGSAHNESTTTEATPKTAKAADCHPAGKTEEAPLVVEVAAAEAVAAGAVDIGMSVIPDIVMDMGRVLLPSARALAWN